MENDRLDLFYARMLGENKFGFHFAYLQGSYKYDDGEEVTDEYSTSAYEFGLGLTAMQNKLDISADVAFLSWKNYHNGADISKPDGNMVIQLNGRYWYEVDQKVTLVPHGSVMNVKFAAKDDDDYKWQEKYMVFDAGLGMNYNAAAGIMAIGDFGIQYAKEEYKESYDGDEAKDKYTYVSLPYFRVGLDAVVFNWMDLRLGAVSYWTNYKHDTDPSSSKVTEKYVETYTFLGAGFHWNNLTLDAYVDPAILLDGFDFISGGESGYYGGYDSDLDYYDYNGMNYQVSLKYNMF